MEVILFIGTSGLVFLTAVIVILVFIFTGRGNLVEGRDFKLTSEQQHKLTSLEAALDTERNNVLGQKSENGKCNKKWEKFRDAVKTDRSYDISASFVSLYECFHQNECDLKIIDLTARHLRNYAKALIDLTEAKERMLQDNPALTPKEKLSLTSKRLKSVLLPYDIDLVLQTIRYRDAIKVLHDKYPENTRLIDLLDVLSANPANPSKLYSLVDMFKSNLPDLQNNAKEILNAQEKASRALVMGYRRWKKAQKFKYTASNPNAASGTFKKENAFIYQEFLRATNRVFLTKQAIARLSVYSTIHSALSEYSTGSEEVTNALDDFFAKPDFKKLTALVKATRATPQFKSHIIPIIDAYKSQSKSRLLALYARCDIKYEEARQQSPELTKEEFKKGDGAGLYAAALAHRQNDYLRVENELSFS